MAYEKTEWKAREGSNLNRFEKSLETSRSVILHNAPNSITEKGTPFSIQNMNKIEQGIYDAHEMIAVEEQARILGDAAVLENARNYTDGQTAAEAQARIQGDAAALASARSYTDAQVGAHDDSDNAHPKIQDILDNLVELPKWDDKNYIFTFRTHNGSTLVIDLPLEALAKDIDYDPVTKEIILHRKDGSIKKIPVSDLVDIYTGSIGTHVQVTVDSNNVIRAVLLAGSVGETQLTAALVNKINAKLDASAVQASEPTAQSTDAQATSARRLWLMLGAALSTLRTNAKTIVGAINELFDNKLNASARGAVNGVASLGPDGLVPMGQLPSAGGLMAVSSDSSLSGSGTAASPLGVAWNTGNPFMDGAATPGDGTQAARWNHRHPVDTTRAPLASPALTGTPTAPVVATIPRTRNPNSTITGATDSPAALADWGNQIVSMNTLRNALIQQLFPVGAYYVQYPRTGQSTIANMFPANESPASLFGGTWTELYAGEDVFFRTGALGSRRGQTWSNNAYTTTGGTPGIEPDAIRNIISLSRVSIGGIVANDIFVTSGSNWLEGTREGFTDGRLDVSRRFPTDTVTRPRNRLVRVWKRTA